MKRSDVFLILSKYANKRSNKRGIILLPSEPTSGFSVYYFSLCLSRPIHLWTPSYLVTNCPLELNFHFLLWIFLALLLSHIHVHKVHPFSSALLVQITSINQMSSFLSLKLFSLGLGQCGYWWLHIKDSLLFSSLLFWFSFFIPVLFCVASYLQSLWSPLNLHVAIPPLFSACFFSVYVEIHLCALKQFVSWKNKNLTPFLHLPLCRRLNDNEIAVLEATGIFKKLPNLRKM